MTPEDWPNPHEDFTTQRERHLKSVAALYGMSPTGHPLSCDHYNSLEFLEITVNAEGDYYEVWRCPRCREISHIPYKPQGDFS